MFGDYAQHLKDGSPMRPSTANERIVLQTKSRNDDSVKIATSGLGEGCQQLIVASSIIRNLTSSRALRIKLLFHQSSLKIVNVLLAHQKCMSFLIKYCFYLLYHKLINSLVE